MDRFKKLSEVAEIVDSLHQTPSYCEKGFPMVRVTDIKSRVIDFEGTLKVDEDVFNEFTKKYNPKKGDILMTRVGSYGTCSYVNSDIQFCLGQNTVVIIPEIDSNYLYYWLTSDFVKRQIDGFVTGSTQKTISLRDIRNILVEVRNNNSSIAKVLSDLDAKIELNNKINAELEAMAKLIYDYWFVQFDFPDENGKPYKSSGGKMVFNEELKREIPEGWDNCLLGDVVERTGTGLNPRDNFKLGEGDNYYVTIKNIEQGRVVLDHRCDKVTDQSLEIINNRSDLRKGDILYTSIQPVGTTYLLREKPGNWNINESVFTIRPDYNKVSSEFLYMFVSGEYIKAYTNNVSAGSIHKGVRHGTLKECKFLLPERSIVDSFTNKLIPILDKLNVIDKENQKLAELRDWLLPMLMNGQVKVN